MNLLTLNIIIALIWLGLSSQLGMASFIIGFITGFIILSLFQPLFSRDHYIIKVYKVLLFIYKFTQALIISNIDIIKAVLCTRKEDIHPNLIAIKTSDMTKKEVDVFIRIAKGREKLVVQLLYYLPYYPHYHLYCLLTSLHQ